MIRLRKLPSAIAVINRRRPDLEALFSSPDLPSPKNRRRALRYLEESCEIVNEGRETAPT